MQRCGLFVEQELGEAFVAGVGNRAPRRGPGEYRLGVLDALFLGFRFRHTGPGDLGVGISHGWNLPGIEMAWFTRRDLGCDVGLVHGLVRQHRLSDDVADGKDVIDVGAHLAVDR